MNFRRKIGLSFLLLTLLTAATGSIGLVFINRILDAFGAVSGVSGSTASDLAGLNRQARRAVLISQEFARDMEIADIQQLRREFARTVQEFDRSFNKIRRDIEDEMYLGTLERFREEQSQFEAQTNELIGAIIAELAAEDAYGRALTASDADWSRLVAELGEAARETAAGGFPGAASLPASLAFFQQLLLEMRLSLKEYLAVEESGRLAAAAAEIEALQASCGAAAAALEAAAGRAVPAARTYDAWAAGLLGEGKLLALYRDGLALKNRTDALIAGMSTEMEDSLRSLDTVIALSGRLSAGGSDRGFVTAAPKLLVIAVAVATVLSAALALVLSHAITRPVKQLTAATEAVRAGDYSRRLEIGSRDELAVLASAFNRMVRRINRSQEEVRLLNDDLERRVKERTAELEETIRQRESAEEETRRKQEQLIQAGKMASLGVLVAGVAHEINNPNQAVMTGAQLLRKTWPDIRTVLDDFYAREGDFLLGGISYSELKKDMDERYEGIVASSRRIDAIVQGLKDFARQGRADMTQIVNLNLVVKSSLILLDSMIRAATDALQVELSPGIPPFRGNAQRVEQVVVNLVQNACQALPDKSRAVFITTAYDEARRRVVLEVSDQGRGISREDLAKVCDPFFTTRREEGGTGLGLSVTSTIVKDHRGELELRSEPGQGTAVRVLFPADRDKEDTNHG